MIIPKLHFPIYGIIIVLSIIIGILYIYGNLKKEKYNNKQILLYFFMYLVFAFIFGKIYTVLAYGKDTFFEASLSAYGGLIGVVIASVIYEKILPANGRVIKYTILSLPLVYGLTKIACFVVGCCGGIPYTGIFKVKYINGLNIWQFPIQITETIVFLIIFIICHLLRNKKNISYITLILASIFKFLLDFLRYDHLNIIITKNQIFSIILILVVVIIYIKDRKKENY